ncbi:protein LURP-one-related 15-like isoform X2 [Canna indica]|uniref:Protein LURP-one-related 15-like isoform X2 n=1 Tax=Canna indica TaxID=4628 RepID=A0AAQ3L1T7_9LILI|nr:protein LURP-one-related 15-like isoform X2 [Canna indica]
MALVPLPTPMTGPPNGPVVVVGQQFCAPYAVDLTIAKKTFSMKDSLFSVTDVNGNVLLQVKDVVLKIRDRCVLLDAAGFPLLTMQQKILSAHRRWQVFRGESTDKKDALFSVKKSRLLQFTTELNVKMACNKGKHVCDFKIRGTHFERACTIYLGKSNCIIAQMSRKHTVSSVLLGKDTFNVKVSPHVDFAFIASLIIILDEINKERNGED